jgi:hypothetical protein
LFYSENKNEKETDRRTNRLTDHFGDGEEIGAGRRAAGREAMRSLRIRLYTFDGISRYGRSLLGLPPFKDQRLARFGPADLRTGVGREGFLPSIKKAQTAKTVRATIHRRSQFAQKNYPAFESVT